MNLKQTLWIFAGASLWLAFTPQASAHCDTMDGPVIKDARAALATEDVTRVLKWILPHHEVEIRNLFQQVLSARRQGEPAKSLSERYFFESLVRIHRAGEDAPYTGLKPAGQVEPVVAASDGALDQENIDELVSKITQRIEHEIRQRFQKTLENRKHANHSVEDGRAYVRAYVEFTHYVENLHNTLAGTAHGHGPSSPDTPSRTTQEASHEH